MHRVDGADLEALNLWLASSLSLRLVSGADGAEIIRGDLTFIPFN